MVSIDELVVIKIDQFPQNSGAKWPNYNMDLVTIVTMTHSFIFKDSWNKIYLVAKMFSLCNLLHQKGQDLNTKASKEWLLLPTATRNDKDNDCMRQSQHPILKEGKVGAGEI